MMFVYVTLINLLLMDDRRPNSGKLDGRPRGGHMGISREAHAMYRPGPRASFRAARGWSGTALQFPSPAARLQSERGYEGRSDVAGRRAHQEASGGYLAGDDRSERNVRGCGLGVRRSVRRSVESGYWREQEESD